MLSFPLALMLIGQARSCNCELPAVGYLDANGSCNCPCSVQAKPLLKVDTITGPKGPGVYEPPSTWNTSGLDFDDDYDDDFGYGYGGWLGVSDKVRYGLPTG
jgi:hypothetical protein